MYTVMLSRTGFNGNGLLWSDTGTDPDRFLLEMSLKLSVTEIPTFEFTILPSHPLYNEIVKFKTLVTISRGTSVLFYGRIINDGSDFYGQRQVTCEGALSFLLDSIVAPKTYSSNTAPKTLLQYVITQHNTQMSSETYKQFTVGNVTVTKKKNNVNYEMTDSEHIGKKFKIENYEQSRSVIDSLLIKEYKGVLSARYENSTLYLDWVKEFKKTNSQQIKMAVNLLDRTCTENVDDYYTVLLPIGRNKKTISDANNGSIYLEDATAISRYGRIVKIENFDERTAAKLKEKAQEEFDKRGSDLPRSYSVKAVDMYLLDGTSPVIELGDVLSSVEDRDGTNLSGLTVVEFTTNLINPAEDEYTLENQEAIDQRLNSDRGNGTLSSRTGGISGGFGGDSRKFYKNYLTYYLEVDDTLREQSRKHEIITKVLEIQAADIYNQSFDDSKVQEVTIDGVTKHIKTISGTQAHQTSEGSSTWVQELTGVIVQLETDPLTGKDVWKPVYAKDSMGNDICDLVTGDRMYATQADMEANQVHIPMRSASVQTQDEFYQVVGSTDIKVVLNTPPEAANAADFNTKTQYYTGDYVYHIENGVKKLYIYNQNHKGAWNAEHVTSVALSTIQTMTGSELWQDKDNVVAVVGEFEISETIPTEAQGALPFSETRTFAAKSYCWYPPEGKHRVLYKFISAHTGPWTGTDAVPIQTKTVAIRNGSGMSVYQDGVKVGLFENGEMNAGLMVESLNARSSDMPGNAFLSTHQYEVGDYCSRNGKVYQCTTRHKGAWDASHFTEASGKIVKLKADVIDLGEFATVDTLNANIIKVNNLTSDNIVNNTRVSSQYVTTNSLTVLATAGVSGSGSISAANATISSRLNVGSLYYWEGGDDYIDVGNAILELSQYSGTGSDKPPEGMIGFKYTTINGTPGTINFNIADTAKYKADVGISTVTEAGWAYFDTQDRQGYYNKVTSTPKAGNAVDTYVAFPTGCSVKLNSPVQNPLTYATATGYGPNDSATITVSKNLYLKADNDYCYIVNENANPIDYGQTGANVIARISNPKPGGQGTVTSITHTSLSPASSATKATGITLGVSGTNLSNSYTDNTFSLTKSTYNPTATTSSVCVNLEHDGTVIGRIDAASFGGLSAAAISQGHDSDDFNDTGLSPFLDKTGTALEANKYYRVLVTANNGERGGVKFKTAKNTQTATRVIGSKAYVASSSYSNIYVKIQYTYGSNTYYKSMSLQYAPNYNDLPSE